MASIQPVILCGGSGTRLWPLSRKAFPKQFVPLVDGRSLLSLTLQRVGSLADPEIGVICVGSEEHRFLVQETLTATQLTGSIILEPVARNTAAAMTLAALAAHTGGEHVLLFCPSDHHIPDASAFGRMVREAVPAALEGAIVTFGVQPTFPSTAYGYIKKGQPRENGGHTVRQFLEKPDASSAEQLILGGDVLWNAGIFLCTPAAFLEGMAQHAPDILASCRVAMAEAKVDGSFRRPAAEPLQPCRSQSIDYAVIERHPNVVVYPFSGAWSDVGSWNAVAQMSAADADGNRVEGRGYAVAARNNFIHAPHRCVVALGVDDLLIVDTPDAVLVTRRDAAEQVKDVVAELERRGSPEAVSHRKVARPWGFYDSIEAGERFQVKRIVVKPLASLSLQLHYHRAEHWVVVRGTAEVTRGAETFLLTENQSTYIPLGEVHRLRNPGKTPLEMIEVQSGSYLGEDDIVRVEDDYGRTPGRRDG
ncbi:MAG TPA: mannose-1-phosphate guanylyltransferase/mannose-6-phosphate isomerase [Ramlibacter sp.]|jgi:mannose-1-phosphate guanylyltransferase/mannose-6-phosphate isomerase|uniref:mannose-1-phosphate guanylyltransferase/mannose-6-phosphate isomerase n=1 Tax=Ramlibacter sp. TaxID=1917967 RepID=UPI002D4A2AA7|nr:mannose-1-phosphate guanylyltransferase/mannose-6-phosphate isomerase [Ramlibacter sp.]HZY20082.1 mannose-1-phosphate guanylyltransferase/mannose-6-phosphate isomerase [Ramlibacter sp.]